MLFDAVVEDSGLSSVGNDFKQQAEMEAEKLVELLDGKGKVAVMHGVTTSATHIERYEGHMQVLEKYPDIEVIDGGASSDDVQTAQQQAAAVIAANPDLDGYLCVDGAAPIGISAAIEEAGKPGKLLCRCRKLGTDSSVYQRRNYGMLIFNNASDAGLYGQH